MIKKAYFVGGVCAVLFFSIHASTSKANKAEKVDAVTSATLHEACQFTLPIAVTSNSATIEWNEYHPEQGSATLSYGTSKTNLTKRDVTLNERANMKLVLTGLSPNTNYFLFYEATSTEHDPYGDTTSIKTQKLSRTMQSFTNSKNIPLELLDHSVRLGSQAKPGDRLIISDCEGRTFYDHSVSGNDGIIGLPTASKGVYVLIYSRHGKLLDNKRFIIVNK
jgi:hypothetical protein